MGSNYYFNNYDNQSEQNLVEDLIIESIKIYGIDVFFVPRTLVKKDDIYGEDTLSTYDSAWSTDLYVNSYSNFEGDGAFLSKFNLEIRDEVNFSLARKTFRDDIGANTNRDRPLEGDLIYVPMMKKLLIVKYVDNTPTFYQMGALQIWNLRCEVFEYSNERFNTGISEIDAIATNYSFAGTNTTVVSNTAFEDALNDVFADNQELHTEGTGLIDWTEIDPFSGGNVG
jgi:hypothetical protein